MEYGDLWKVLIQVFMPTVVFVGIGFGSVYMLSRFLGKVRVRGGGILLAAFAALGGILGVAVGASRVPAVGATLPALLTTITVLLGYLFGKEQLSEWRPVIPYCILVLIATAFFGLFAGSSIRGKQEEFERNYERRLLYYKQVELEIEKVKKLRELGHSRGRP